jgi:hypothetical protein
LGDVACLSPDAALQRLSSTAGSLTMEQVEERLRSAGLNQVAHQTHHTILGELVGARSTPLYLLLQDDAGQTASNASEQTVKTTPIATLSNRS